MCRGFREQYERDRLTIKSFYVQLLVPDFPTHLPDFLTLCYLPRITESPLDIDDFTIRPDSTGFVTLHRVVSAGGAVYGSRERVRASEGVRFEVYLREEKVVNGIFRKDDDGEWKLECKCGLDGRTAEVKEAEVCVAAEGTAETMNVKVEMVAKRKRKGRCFLGLEEIPEEREVDCESEDDDCCCCCLCEEGRKNELEGGVWEEEESSEEEREGMEAEIEGVRWAVDLGIWVVCLGVGYLVSKASAKSLRRRRLLS